MLKRKIQQNIDSYLANGNYKILFIWGPRRSGKTTILRELGVKLNAKVFNFDLISDREYFEPRREILDKLVKDNPIILIDEVQSFPESTLSLKVLFDEYKVKIIATGSSELRKKTSDFDSLADRYQEIFCLPISSEEAVQNSGVKAFEQDQFLKSLQQTQQIFGSYPEIYTNTNDRERIDNLQIMLDTYVLKDVIDIYNLKDLSLAKNILKKIALQLGSEVSLREIASSLQSNVATVSNYIEIFIKNYILIQLPSFKTNLRRAVSENRKLYFFDLGIRNALIHDFRDLESRQDKGAVFENFIISEVEKRKRIEKLHLNLYFYREYDGREVDLVIEDYKKKYSCFEVKSKQERINKVFPIEHQLELIEPRNYFDKIYSINPKI